LDGLQKHCMFEMEEYDKDFTIPSCHLSQMLDHMQRPFDGQYLPLVFSRKQFIFQHKISTCLTSRLLLLVERKTLRQDLHQPIV